MVRVKRRYILFEIIANETKSEKLSITERDLITSIRETIGKLYGDFGLGSVMPTMQLKRFNAMTRTGVLATKRLNHTIALTSLPFVRRVQHLDCIIRTIHMSGTIRGCLKALRIHHKKQIIKLRNELNSSIQIKNIENGVKDIETSLLSAGHLVSDPDIQIKD